MAQRTLGDKDILPVLNSAIVELREVYRQIGNTFDQLRIKALTLIAGEVAIATFIFTQDFPVPNNPSGIIFLGTAIALLLTAFILLMWIISPLLWAMPLDIARLKGDEYRKFESEIEFKEYVKEEYIQCIDRCGPPVNKRAKNFNWVIYLLSIGVIILIVIKYGG